MTQKPHPAIEERRLPAAWRLMPSVTDFAFLMPIIFLFARMNGAKSILGDGDTGWHIRTGEWILAHRSVPRQDLFSFTMPGQPWFAWEWLWDVCFGWIHLHWGLTGVVLLSMLLLSAASVMLFRLTLRVSNNAVIAMGATFLAVAASAVHWLARPHLSTILFTVIFLTILERVRPVLGITHGATSEEGSWAKAQDGMLKRALQLIWLPVLTILWTNLHGGFFVGIVILAIYAAGSLLEWVFDTGNKSRLVWAGRYALTALGCAAASLVNPYTYHLHVHIFEYFRDPYHLDNVQEFQTLSFHAAGAGFFEVLLLLALPLAARELSKRRFTTVMLIGAWAHLSLLAGRNIPLFAMIVAPILARTGSELLEQGGSLVSGLPAWFANLVNGTREALEEFALTDRIPRVHLVSVLGALVLAVGLFGRPDAPKWRAEFDPKLFPVAAVDYLEPYAAAHRVFSTDQWGDYLTYRLYPQGGRVFIDGRSDFYGSEFGRSFIEVAEVNYKWQSTLDRYAVDTVLLPVSSPLAGALKETSRWRAVYDDGMAIVFTASNSFSASGGGKFSTTSGKGCDTGSSPKEVTGGSQLPIETKERTNL